MRSKPGKFAEAPQFLLILSKKSNSIFYLTA
jgi:hypothetical protein